MNGHATKTEELSGQRFFPLLGTLRAHVGEMLKKEFHLLKTELGEKCACMGKQSGMVAAGGLMAYSGLMLFLVGLCTLIAFALTKAGLPIIMALWIAFLALGLVIAGGGYLMLQSALATLKKTSVAPKETLYTVKELSDPEKLHVGIPESAKSESGKTHVARVSAEKKIEQVQSELAELHSRLSPKYMLAATRTGMSRRPKLTASIGASVMALAYLMIRRRRHRFASIA